MQTTLTDPAERHAVLRWFYRGWRRGRIDPSESEIRALVDSRSDAIGNRDLDRLMSLYAPDIVYFDLVPPLQYARVQQHSGTDSRTGSLGGRAGSGSSCRASQSRWARPSPQRTC